MGYLHEKIAFSLAPLFGTSERKSKQKQNQTQNNKLTLH